jgi:hypothetical protein
MKKYATDKGYQHHYYRFYEPLFSPMREAPIRLLEIGVEGGKSMMTWKEYFPNAALLAGIGYGSSFNQNSCNGKIRCYNGDQSDVKFLDSVIKDSGGKFDIIIDDGSHNPAHQFITLTRLLQNDAIMPNGLYIVEDIETSYWNDDAQLYGYRISNGGLNAPCSFIERTKRLADVINREYINSNYHTIRDKIDQRIASLQFVQNMVIMRVATSEEISLMSRQYRFSGYVTPVAENKTQILSDLCDKKTK